MPTVTVFIDTLKHLHRVDGLSVRQYNTPQTWKPAEQGQVLGREASAAAKVDKAQVRELREERNAGWRKR